MDHGHSLLIRVLDARGLVADRDRPVTLLEVGSTREVLPGQGSTRILALYCRDRGWDFVTCDMDPINAENARLLFGELGLPFTAVRARGERYLARNRDAFDAVYLDAYDFDHGAHSEVRQQRYVENLGERIDQEACERMHLRAMKALQQAGTRQCVVVIDDTWVDEHGQWQGKGPRAVPWAERNGWRIVEVDADSQAVALERDPGYWTLRSRALRSARGMSRRLRRRLRGA